MENAQYLIRKLEKIPGITHPFIKPNVTHCFHQFTVRVEEDFPLSRDEFADYLYKKNIGYGIYYPMPIHRQPVFEKMGYSDKTVNCPKAIEVAQKVLSLPIHTGVTQLDLEYIVNAIKTAKVE